MQPLPNATCAKQYQFLAAFSYRRARECYEQGLPEMNVKLFQAQGAIDAAASRYYLFAALDEPK